MAVTALSDAGGSKKLAERGPELGRPGVGGALNIAFAPRKAGGPLDGAQAHQKQPVSQYSVNQSQWNCDFCAPQQTVMTPIG